MDDPVPWSWRQGLNRCFSNEVTKVKWLAQRSQSWVNQCFPPVPYQWPSNIQQSLPVNLYPWIWVSLDNTDLVFAMLTLLAITREDSKKRHQLLNTQNVPGDFLGISSPKEQAISSPWRWWKEGTARKLNFLEVTYCSNSSKKIWDSNQTFWLQGLIPSRCTTMALNLGITFGSVLPPTTLFQAPAPAPYIYTQAIRELRIFLKQERSPEA